MKKKKIKKNITIDEEEQQKNKEIDEEEKICKNNVKV